MLTAAEIKQKQRLQGFHIDWDDQESQFSPEYVAWTAVERPRRWHTTLARAFNNNLVHLIYHNHVLNAHSANDTEWKFQNVLGQGSFGAVAHFIREDHSGDVLDEVAIKATRDNAPQRDNSRWPDVPFEAAIMAQLNDLHRSPFLTLRNFKHSYDIKQTLTDLYYLEYGTCGTLMSLKAHYMAWSKHFPEAFLWHLFDSFVTLCIAMEQGPFRHLGKTHNLDGQHYAWGDRLPGAYLCHGDIKPADIFLTIHYAARMDTGLAGYPSVLLGDYGCARVLHESLPASKRFNHTRGTLCYLPPELRLAVLPIDLSAKFQSKAPQGLGYRFAQLGGYLGSAISKPFTTDLVRPASNLWAFSAVIWELMTLRSISELSKQVELRKFRAPLGERRDTMLDGDIMYNVSKNAPAYSKDLIVLLKQCLQYDHVKRPDLSALQIKVRTGLHRFQSPPLATPVDYKGALGELGHRRQLGNLDLSLNDTFWAEFKQLALYKPPEANLNFPPNVHETNMAAPAHWPEDLRGLWEERVAGTYNDYDEYGAAFASRSAPRRNPVREKPLPSSKPSSVSPTSPSGKRKVDEVVPKPTSSIKRRRPTPQSAGVSGHRQIRAVTPDFRHRPHAKLPMQAAPESPAPEPARIKLQYQPQRAHLTRTRNIVNSNFAHDNDPTPPSSSPTFHRKDRLTRDPIPPTPPQLEDLKRISALPSFSIDAPPPIRPTQSVCTTPPPGANRKPRSPKQGQGQGARQREAAALHRRRSRSRRRVTDDELVAHLIQRGRRAEEYILARETEEQFKEDEVREEQRRNELERRGRRAVEVEMAARRGEVLGRGMMRLDSVSPPPPPSSAAAPGKAAGGGV